MLDEAYNKNVLRLISKAKSKGLIKEYSDFINEKEAEDYNLLQEEVEYYESEHKKQSYKKYKVGDIVFVSNYIYKNSVPGYNHIFVIISEGQVVDINYFGFLLSSKLNKASYTYNKRLNKNKQNNLYKNSIVKCDDLIKINEDEIKFKIGEVSPNYLESFVELYLDYLENDNQ